MDGADAAELRKRFNAADVNHGDRRNWYELIAMSIAKTFPRKIFQRRGNISTSSSRAMRRLSRGLAATQCRVGGSTISRWTP
jgi:hypothetical protein